MMTTIRQQPVHPHCDTMAAPSTAICTDAGETCRQQMGSVNSRSCSGLALNSELPVHTLHGAVPAHVRVDKPKTLQMPLVSHWQIWHETPRMLTDTDSRYCQLRCYMQIVCVVSNMTLITILE